MSDRLRLDHVSVRHDDATTDALHDVSIELAAGEVLAVLGSSGSGKSTLLRAIVGLDALSAGRVLLDGADLTGVPTHRRGIGLMFQDHVLFPHLDVADNVAFGLRMQRVARPAREHRVAELLDLVGLAGFGDRAVTSLSGGERQRVALARALAPEPAVLLLDEPMGSLDRSLRERLVDDLGALFDELGTTAVMVTHDHVEATALGDRLVVLDAGVIVQQGTPQSVAAAPLDTHIARLMGVPTPD